MKMESQSKKENEQDYEYQIYVDDKLIWHGLNPAIAYDDIVKKNPDKKISVAWKPKEGILIAII